MSTPACTPAVLARPHLPREKLAGPSPPATSAECSTSMPKPLEAIQATTVPVMELCTNKGGAPKPLASPDCAS